MDEVVKIQELEKENAVLKERMKGMVEMSLAYQWYIPRPPLNNTQLYGQACANDAITVGTWMKDWIANTRENVKYDFHANSIMNEHGKFAMKPGIIAGSGPSLRKNAHLLKERGGVPLVSCLHNFAFFEDLGVHPEYYLNLDAGPITIEELSQGGKEKPEHYWERTKDHTLLTVVQGHPQMHERWQGKKLWFATVIPDQQGQAEILSLTKDFTMFVQCGGNALGACLYFARAVLGCCPVAFIGADFCFSYTKKFHPFDSPYDQKFAGVIPATDIFGNRVYTWQSYFNFKTWFEFIACGGAGGNPQMFFNCTEGGILGAWQDGNIIQIQQMSLEQFIKSYTLYQQLPDCVSKKMLLF